MRFRNVLMAVAGGLLSVAAWGQAPLGAGAPMQMPPGHPDFSSKQPSTQPAATSGTLTVRAVQGTKGASVAAGDPVSVQLVQQSKVLRKLDAKLAADGTATFADVPLLLPFHPYVTIQHNGIDYSTMGPMMNGSNPTRQVDVTIYEATDQAPAWQISMRHVMTEPAAEGVRVMEMLAIENVSDRTWLGTLQAGGTRTTLALPLPAGAKDIEIGGDFHEGCTRVENGRLVSSDAIVPGVTKLQLGYTLVAKGGPVQFTVSSPVTVKQMLVFASGGGSGAKAEGLEDQGVHDMGKMKAQMFRGAELKAGQEIALTIPVMAMASATTPATSMSAIPKAVAGIGALLILVLGVGVILLKPWTPRQK